MRMSSGFQRPGALITCVAAFTLAGAPATSAQEHPEHPKETESSEHPEHPEDASQRSAVTKDSMAAAIEAYVGSDTELKGGYFFVYDRADADVLSLTLDRVHRERVSKVADNQYFACADFLTTDGNAYDLDFFMEADDHGKLVVTDIMVHKEAGEPRYTWREADGIWTRDAVE